MQPNSQCQRFVHILYSRVKHFILPTALATHKPGAVFNLQSPKDAIYELGSEHRLEDSGSTRLLRQFDYRSRRCFLNGIKPEKRVFGKSLMEAVWASFFLRFLPRSSAMSERRFLRFIDAILVINC